MPLLSMPRELLLNIIRLVVDTKLQTRRFNRTLYLRSLRHIAQTCQVLRSLSITIIYSIVAFDPEVGELGEFLTDYPNITACIRFLKIKTHTHMGLPNYEDLVTSKRNQYYLLKLLKNCSKLRELSLIHPSAMSKTSTSRFDYGLLQHLPPEALHSLQKIRFKEFRLGKLLIQFNILTERGFCALGSVEMQKLNVYTAHSQKTKRKDEHMINSLLHPGNISPPKLELVRTFNFHAAFRYRCCNEQAVGEFFAKTMPNVRALNMNTAADYIYGAISTYASLGSQLTELTLDASHIPLASGYAHDDPLKDFCNIITKISPHLTRFTAGCGAKFRICHKLFASVDDWPNLTFLKLTCRLGCRGIDPDQFREGLGRLIAARPRICISVRNQFRRNLVSWDPSTGLDYMAPLKQFKKLSALVCDTDSDSDENEIRFRVPTVQLSTQEEG